LLAAVGDRESCFQQNAKGGSGEIGMMQVKSTTAFLYGFDPRILKTAYGNVTVSARILATELAKYSPHKALLVYNQGHPGDIGGTYATGVMSMYRKLEGK
jgi:soluble lytic murein transglycosylase-like protein